MGQEAVCTVRWGGRSSEGKAQLETAELRFRGEFRLRIPLRTIASVEARDGELTVAFADGTATFELGRQAERWAARIKNPPSRLDKLGVKEGQRISVLDVREPGFLEQLRERGADVEERPRPDADLILVGVEQPSELDRLGELAVYLKPNGGIWVVSPKGRRDLRDVDVYAAAKLVGLVDVKVAAFSATHTANKLVIPVTARRVR